MKPIVECKQSIKLDIFTAQKKDLLNLKCRSLSQLLATAGTKISYVKLTFIVKMPEEAIFVTDTEKNECIKYPFHVFNICNTIRLTFVHIKLYKLSTYFTLMLIYTLRRERETSRRRMRICNNIDLKSHIKIPF